MGAPSKIREPEGGTLPEGVTLFKSQVPYDSSPEVSEDDAALFGSGNRAFAFELYRRLQHGDNLFLSPFSISVALGVTLPGARGSTETEMRSISTFRSLGYTPLSTARYSRSPSARTSSPRTAAGPASSSAS